MNVAPVEGVDWRPPDGRELIFRGQVGAKFAIYAIRPDGTGIRQISANGTDQSFWTHYAITADGSKLLYGERDSSVEGYPDGRVDLRMLDLDTRADTLWGGALPDPEVEGVTFTGPQHWGGAVLSPDGKTVAFGRYWGESDGMINHQVFVATLASDGADALPIGKLHRSQSGQGPFDYGFSPDGKHLIVQYFDQQVTWLADPSDGTYDVLPWGNVTDPPSWQRIAPE
jgi:Tol biopolymer transport system component